MTPRPTVVLAFANPYQLAAFPTVGSYLLAWGDREVSQNAAVKSTFQTVKQHLSALQI